VGSASFDAATFNSVDSVSEIGSSLDSPVGDWCFEDFRISDAEIGFRADLVTGDDRISTVEGVLVSDKKPVGDWLFLDFRIGDAEIAKAGIASV